MRALAAKTPGGRRPLPADTATRTRRARSNVARASPRRHGDGDDDRPSPPPPSSLPPLLAAGIAGATAGPLLDGIHSSVGLQVYDLLPIDIGPLHTSALVPPLLSAFYVTLTLLDVAAERAGRALAPRPPAPADAASPDAPPPTPSPLTVAACYASLAAGLALSAALHARQVPPPQIAAALAAFTAANFCAFDRTPRGLALALLCAAVAPLAEAQLMARFGAWHYPRADAAVPVLLSGLFASGGEGGGGGGVPPSSVGFVSWVPLCYAFYAPSVLLLGRRLRAKRDSEAKGRRRN